MLHVVARGLRSALHLSRNASTQESSWSRRVMQVAAPCRSRPGRSRELPAVVVTLRRCRCSRSWRPCGPGADKAASVVQTRCLAELVGSAGGVRSVFSSPLSTPACDEVVECGSDLVTVAPFERFAKELRLEVEHKLSASHVPDRRPDCDAAFPGTH